MRSRLSMYACAVAVLLSRNALAADAFQPVASFPTERTFTAGIRLADGRVLVTGGGDANGNCVADANVYDPVTGAFETIGPMAEARKLHQMALLADGRVLIVGGYCAFMSSTASAEIYDPSTHTFTPTGSMIEGRARFTATTLADGRVLVAGGGIGGRVTAEIYDPATGTFAYTGSMSVPREDHTATLLPSGGVLIVGGWDNFLTYMTDRQLEVFDPATGTFGVVGAMTEGRAGHSATLLEDGTVLLAGGFNELLGYLYPLNTADVFDPLSGIVTPIGPMGSGHRYHGAAKLGEGLVLIVGGCSYYDGPAEIYDPVARGFAVSAQDPVRRSESVVAVGVGAARALVAGASSLVELWVAGSTAPSVVSTAPTDGAIINPGRWITLTIRFSESMFAGTDLAAVALTFQTGDGPVAILVHADVSGNALVLTPASSLPANKTFSVTVPATAVVDGGGHALAAPYTFSFTSTRR